MFESHGCANYCNRTQCAHALSGRYNDIFRKAQVWGYPLSVVLVVGVSTIKSSPCPVAGVCIKSFHSFSSLKYPYYSMLLVYMLDTYVYTKYDPAFLRGWCVYEVDFFLKTSLFVMLCMSVGRMGASTALMLKICRQIYLPKEQFLTPRDKECLDVFCFVCASRNPAFILKAKSSNTFFFQN